MKNLIILISISILLIALTCTCEKEETEIPLPPNTEIGANTFIFRVNGGEIIESKVGYIPANPRLRVSYNHVDTFLHNDYLFQIRGRRELLREDKRVEIFIKKLAYAKNYSLQDEDYAYYKIDEDMSLHYYTDNEHQGELNITKLDTINHVISGKFKFNAKLYCQEEECNEIVTVEGQFDVKYKPNEGVNYY